MKVEIDKETNEVIIRLLIEKEPKDSASGKTKSLLVQVGETLQPKHTTESS